MNVTELYEIYRQFPNVTTDSRNVSPGSIFFALKGDNFNGNRFAEDALAKGAAYAIVDENTKNGNPKLIKVDDCLKTLQLLARIHRETLGIPVIAITGSNGKTTTKELCRDVLMKKFRLHATKGNLNNHIGVPLTILSAHPETDMMFVEMGANHQGEIDQLCRIAVPDYGAITNIGKAHLEGFGGIEGVKKGKSELYRFISANGGIIFLNEDDEVLSSLIPSDAKLIKYSPSQMFANVKMAPFISFSLTEINTTYHTKITGAYNLENIALSIVMGQYFGVAGDDIHDAICCYIPQNNRSQIIKIGSNTFIMDAYNANPSSMIASINSFKNSGYEKKVLILGDMLELGDVSHEEHLKIVKMLDPEDWDDVIFVGPQFMTLNIHSDFRFFADTAMVKTYLNAQDLKDKTILVKGSRGIALEKILN